MGIPHLIVGAAGSVNGAASGAGRTVHAWSARAGYRFPREVIAGAVRWYLRYGLSYGDVEELLAGHRAWRHGRWCDDLPMGADVGRS